MTAGSQPANPGSTPGVRTNTRKISETSSTHAANLFKSQMTMLRFHGQNTGHAGRRADFPSRH